MAPPPATLQLGPGSERRLRRRSVMGIVEAYKLAQGRDEILEKGLELARQLR